MCLGALLVEGMSLLFQVNYKINSCEPQLWFTNDRNCNQNLYEIMPFIKGKNVFDIKTRQAIESAPLI